MKRYGESVLYSITQPLYTVIERKLKENLGLLFFDLFFVALSQSKENSNFISDALDLSSHECSCEQQYS